MDCFSTQVDYELLFQPKVIHFLSLYHFYFLKTNYSVPQHVEVYVCLRMLLWCSAYNQEIYFYLFSTKPYLKFNHLDYFLRICMVLVVLCIYMHGAKRISTYRYLFVSSCTRTHILNTFHVYWNRLGMY